MERRDCIIVGGGLVGLTLALALDRHGLRSHVVDAQAMSDTLAPDFDGRASAIASASARMLRAIGLQALLDDHGCAIERIHVLDRAAPRRLVFDAGASEGGPLGFMVENRRLRQALVAAAAAAPGIALHAPASVAEVERREAAVVVRLAEGAELTADLLVAADGRRSALRDQAGIRVARWSYRQTALVTTIAHAAPHGQVAYEMFYSSGPFAVLPMRDDADGRHRSAIVWTLAQAAAPATLALPPRALAAEISARTQGVLGAIELVAPASAYPLGFHHAERYTDRRLALVGDAAHGIHPIAGQGLNMGLRDAAALAQVLVEGARLGLDRGDAQLLARYQRWRGLDNMMVAGATDVLNRLFAIDMLPFRRLRQAGLAMVDRLPSLKAFFMAEARGETGDLPSLLRGELV